MPRIALILTALAASLTVASSATAAPVAAPAPSLGVRLAACEVGVDGGQGAAEFTGSMPAVAGGSVLEMRFDLEQRRGSTWKGVSLPGFGRWERSNPGAAGFVYGKRVERLVVGSSYRVAVSFRWTAEDGRIVRRVTRRSAACAQPDPRADVAVASLTTSALPDGRTRYVVQVRNGGAAASAGTLLVGLLVDRVPINAQELPGLATGAVGTVAFEGPACALGGRVLALVDTQDDRPEVDDANNALVMLCPAT